MRLIGKAAVITGGTKGLGRIIAESYVAEGCRVLLGGRDVDAVADLVDKYPDQLASQHVDVRDPDSVDRLLQAAVDRFHGLDIVVANAGISAPGRVAALSLEDWAGTFETNVTGTFLTVRAALKHLPTHGGGSVITMSSAMATRVAPGASAYCASKAAIEMLTRVAAVESAARGITVNCLAPGIIDEGMGRALASNEVVWAKYSQKLASGRAGTADEVAAAAVFLAGNDSRYINGHVLEVNGGLDW
jgi:3-oxoacyl-[acyl-carrier protein] reductase